MKLQPNFSWQKYEGKPEDYNEQFQYQLQQQHIQVANSVNATIDDESYNTRERQTSFTWVDGYPIYKKTISGVIVGTAVTTYAHGISKLRKIVEIQGTAQNAEPMTVDAFPLPYFDPTTLLDGIGVYMTVDHVVLTTGNGTWNNYKFSVTIYYTKTR